MSWLLLQILSTAFEISQREVHIIEEQEELDGHHVHAICTILLYKIIFCIVLSYPNEEIRENN